MDFEVLLSCMNESDFSVIERSNLKKVPATVVNQCDTDEESEEGVHRMYKSTLRGLSVSRNTALEKSRGDICLLSDDDEVFRSDLESAVLKAYREQPEADVIIFKMSNYPCKLGSKPKKLKKLDLLKVSSWQISFKTAAVKGKIRFDTRLGAGTENGAGEENKFLLDCRKAGLEIYYVPVEIASVAQENSTWFSGYNERFFFNRGKTTRYILGFVFSVLYALYFLLAKRNLYKKDIKARRACVFLFKGILAKGIDAKYE